MILKKTAKIISVLLFATCIITDGAGQDSTLVQPDTRPQPRSPHRATMLAAALPGMGQVYNRKYWKIPLVYAGFAGLGYGAWFNGSSNVKFLRAYQDFTDIIPETDSYLDVIRGVDPATFDPVLHPDTYNPSDAQWIKEQLLARIDYYKKYRDLSYIGIAAWYLLSILDANVDASLSDYDVGETINISLVPATIPISGGPLFALNIKFVKTF